MARVEGVAAQQIRSALRIWRDRQLIAELAELRRSLNSRTKPSLRHIMEHLSQTHFVRTSTSHLVGSTHRRPELPELAEQFGPGNEVQAAKILQIFWRRMLRERRCRVRWCGMASKMMLENLENVRQGTGN